MRKGFTIVELLIVIIVVGVLAAFAVPQYIATQKKVLQKEALSNLKLIAAAEKIYKMEMGSYVACASASVCNSTLKLSLVTAANATWSYYVTLSAPNCTVWAQSTKLNCYYALSSVLFDTTDYSTTTCS